MVNLTNLQNKINTKVFDNLGSDLLLSARTAGSTDKWGDSTDSIAAPSTIVGVPWMHIKGTLSYQPFGDLEEGSMDMAFKHNQTLRIGDLVYSSILEGSYLIKEVENFPLANGILVKIARLSKKII